MKKKKTYNEAGVEFKHRGAGNWQFDLPTVLAYTLISKSPEGLVGAQKIARILAGSVKRTKGKGVDGMARKMINNIVSPAPENDGLIVY